MKHTLITLHRFIRPALSGSLTLALLLLAGCATMPEEHILVSKWDPFEATLSSASHYANPPLEASLTAVFTSPSGRTQRVYGFWDGGQTWRIRFAPDEVGRWTYNTFCTDSSNAGLHGLSGAFLCTPPLAQTAFNRHGPVQVSGNQRYLAHEDGKPFFWLADTTWNGALKSTPGEWDAYIDIRKEQGFSAVQFVTTQWRAAPNGDEEGRLAFTGHDQIVINPEFFQRLDHKVDELNQNGLLAVPVLLWAIGGGSNPQINPGNSLPEDQAILLARYMVARWGAKDVTWILGGDGDYRGPKSDRWKRIGRAVFSDISHSPVIMHPGGMHWPLDEFIDEPWLDIWGYQSGHGDDDRTLQWIFSGPPSDQWMRPPHRPFLNLEPPYEFHVAYQSKGRISPATVRRAIYWSLLIAPTAGVSYGGHGVWGWDDGTKPPVDHPSSGVPLPLGNAVRMPAAGQMAFLSEFFTSIDFSRLRPALQILAEQPGASSPSRFVAAAQSAERDLTVIYIPLDRSISVKLDQLPPSFTSSWFNPRTGQKKQVVAVVNGSTINFATPSEGDWVLLIQK